MIDFKLFEYAFNVQSDFLLIIGGVITGGIILGTILYCISGFISLFLNILNK